MFISGFVDQTSTFKRYKAPKGFLYEVTDIHTLVTTAGNNLLIFVPRAVEDLGSTAALDILRLTDQEFMHAIPTDIANAFDVEFSEPVLTKFITVGKRTSGVAFEVGFVIVYRLKKASKIDLIWEWFSKNR